MIIDFHTHVYPDKIAKKTVEALSNNSGYAYYTDGTLNGLKESMQKSDVDLSIVLPVQTRVGQFDTINNSAIMMNKENENIISFGAIHPDEEDICTKLEYLKSQGIRGIKIHPDYQETFIDDEKYIKVIVKCAELSMLVVTHSGKDPAYDIVHCPAKRAFNMLSKVESRTNFKEPFIVFAHLGEMENIEDLYKYLIGKNCYLDISNSFMTLSEEKIVDIINRHGADKILFATDSPWNDQKEYIEKVNSLNISEKEKRMIFSENAKRLLKVL